MAFESSWEIDLIVEKRHMIPIQLQGVSARIEHCQAFFSMSSKYHHLYNDGRFFHRDKIPKMMAYDIRNQALHFV